MPTAVESITSLGAVVVQLPQSSSHIVAGDNWMAGMGAAAPAPATFGTRELASGPTGQRMHKPYMAAGGPAGELRPDLPKISSALQKVLPTNQKMIEAIGIGTDMATLNALIGLLKTEGYHATISYFDASHRHGFPKPTAILRSHGGSVPTVFLQQVATAMKGVPDDWEGGV